MKKSTLFIGASFLMASGMAFNAQAVELTDVYPTPGTVFNYEEYAELQLVFNAGVKMTGEASIQYTTKAGEAVNHVFESLYVEEYNESKLLYVLFNKDIETMGANGANELTHPSYYQNEVLPNADYAKGFSITVTGVEGLDGSAVTYAANQVGVKVNDGTIVVSYEMGQGPELVQESLPSMFYNYWAEGATDSTATFMFNQDIEYVNEVTVVMDMAVWGSPSGGDEPNPYFTIYQTQGGNINYLGNNKNIVDGKTVTIDFAGIDYQAIANNFVKNDLSAYEMVTLFVQGVYSVSGMPYKSNGLAVMTYYIPFTNAAFEGATPDDTETGINAVGADANGMYRVYNLQGAQVLNTSDVNSVKELKGLYIVNGKKVVIR